MSYLLFLGFKTTIYKKPPTIRVSLNGLFLDEFFIYKNSHNVIEKDELTILDEKVADLEKKNSKLNPNPIYKSISKSYNELLQDSINFKIIEINEDVLHLEKENYLLIEIFNNDNDYTNGFINKSTMVFCNIVHLIPKNSLLNLDEFCDHFNLDKKKHRSTHSKIFSIKDSYKKKCNQFDILDNNVQKNNTLIWFNNLTNKNEEIERTEWIGSEGYFKLFFKKDLIKYTDKSVETYSLNEQLLYGLANKYKEYENQRNTD
jgi:hypothetical protein